MKILNDFKRKYQEGYTYDEVTQIFKEFDDANEKIFFNTLQGITVIEIDGQILFYEIDIEKAIRCSTEKRNLKNHEWD